MLKDSPTAFKTYLGKASFWRSEKYHANLRNESKTLTSNALEYSMQPVELVGKLSVTINQCHQSRFISELPPEASSLR